LYGGWNIRMRTSLLPLLAATGLLALSAPVPAYSGERPGSFRGATDNAYCVLHIDVYYYSAYCTACQISKARLLLSRFIQAAEER
jgi:hypothetical protein